MMIPVNEKNSLIKFMRQASFFEKIGFLMYFPIPTPSLKSAPSTFSGYWWSLTVGDSRFEEKQPPDL
jgi:hypothetical protein